MNKDLRKTIRDGAFVLDDRMIEMVEKEGESEMTKRNEKVVAVKDQEWRKRGPIIMNNGKMVAGDVSNIAHEEITNILIKRLEFIAKVTRGVYSGIYRDDKEYIDFCDNTISKFIKETGEEIVQNQIKGISKIMRVSPKSDIVPATNPTHLRSNSIVDEIIKIDVTKDLSYEEKEELKNNILKKKYIDPEKDPIAPVCNSADCGKSILQILKNKFEENVDACIEDNQIDPAIDIDKNAKKKKVVKKVSKKKKVAKKKSNKTINKNDRK